MISEIVLIVIPAIPSSFPRKREPTPPAAPKMDSRLA